MGILKLPAGSNTVTASNGMNTNVTYGGSGSYTVPFPQNKTEYGKTFQISDQMMGTPDFEMVVLNMVMRDYQQSKMQSFPGWKGFPEIKTFRDMHGMQVAWYALVDDEDIFNTVEEEQLWNE